MEQRENDFLSPPQARHARMPTFPLSSPIAEEPPNPFEETDPFASPEDHAATKGLTSTQDGGLYDDNGITSRWSTDSGSTRRPGPWTSTKRLMRSNSKQTPAKKTRPGLNLITDFSSPSTSTSKPRRQSSRGQNGRAFLDLGDLAELKTRTKRKDQASLNRETRKLLWRRGAKKAYTELRDQNQDEPQPSTDKKMDGISPSDRPIVIGMSVPRGSAGDIDKNNTPDGEETSDPPQQSNDKTPVTPSIVVTPAHDGDESPPGFRWDQDDSAPRSHAARPPSSVYSQATPRFGNRRVESIPPVPALPTNNPFVKTSERDDVFAENTKLSPAKQRPLSADTVFEDDDDNDSPPSGNPNPRPRSLSNDDRDKTWSALDTPSRRKSQGWWNFILSPLLSRSNTTSSRTPQSAQSPPPPLPSVPPLPIPHFNEKERPREVSVFSPDTPEGEAVVSADREKSMRSDITRWPDYHSGRAPGPNSASPKQMPENGISPASAASSSQTIPFMMSSPEQTVASPRCHACAYDSNADPYFGSINHTCAAQRGDQNSEGTIGALSSVPRSPPRNSNPNNPFFQRFVASLRNSTHPARPRSDSESTTFEEEDPAEISPTVREASVTPMLRANGATMTPTPITTRPSPNETPNNDPPPAERNSGSPMYESQPPPYSPPKGKKRYRAIFPPDACVPSHQQEPHSPPPLTPGTQNIISGGTGYHMADHPQRPPVAHTLRSSRDIENSIFPARPAAPPVTLSSLEADTRAANESRRQRLEREDAAGKRVGGLWRGRGCFSNRGCFGREGREGRKRRRWYAVVVAAVLLVIITLSIVLPIMLTRKGHPPPPIESRWLNLTGYPPMPTGVSTIAGPSIARSRAGCIHPTTMWSCALPKEEQESNQPFDPDEPKFMVQIDFLNGTFDHSTVPITPPSGAAKRMLFKRDGSADPPAPSLEDIEFLGNTTDNITAPSFAGEETPFYATFLPALSPSSSSRLRKRADEDGPTFPNLTSAIPSPETNPDGTAAPANLYPLPASQPIRLFDRGLPTEHYGFYTYFDRSIFLKSAEPLSPSKDGETEVVPDDENGGSSKDAACVRCTWAQTRFLVQIWTKPQEAGFELVGNHTTATTGTTSPTESPPSTTPADDEEAFTQPGTFPYPATLTLDRHGGVADEKMVYCYGVDLRGRIERDQKKLQLEFRDFGGTLVNPASGVFNFSSSDAGGAGTGDGIGVDGGTGGCMCEWRNWVKVS